MKTPTGRAPRTAALQRRSASGDAPRTSLGRPLVWAALFAALVCALYGLWRVETLPDRAVAGSLTAVIARVDGDRLLLRDVCLQTEDGVLRPNGRVLMEAEPCGCALEPGMEVRAQVTLEPLRPPANPHGWDERIWFTTDGVVYRCQGRLDAHSASAPFSLRTHLRGKMLEHIRALWPEDADLVSALLLGLEDALDEGTQQDFRRSGTAHLMAVSGLHVGFVAALAALAFRWMKKNSWTQIALVLLCMAGYGLLAESAFSVFRAMVMLAAGLLGRHFGRRPDGPSALALAVLAALALDPLAILRAGFLLSVGAVLGVFLLNGRLDALLRRIVRPAYLRGLVTVSLSAQIGALPAQLYLFHTVNLLSPLTNLAAVPLAAGIVMLGLPTALLHMALPAVAAAPGFVVALLARLLALICGTIAQSPFAQLNVSSVPVLALLCFVGALFLCSPYLMEFGRKQRIALIAAVLCTSAVALGLWLPGELSRRSTPRAVFFSVGTADSALLRSRGGNLLIDTGWTGSQAANYLQAEGLNLDAVLLTHRDSDHAGGLEKILQSAPVGAVMAPCGMSWEGLEEARAAAERRGIPILELRAGDSFTIGEFRLTVLWPESVRSGMENEDSLVLLVESNGQRLLMTGDITRQTEETLRLPDCDAIKVPHHGSATGTSQALLRQAAPETAVLSVGTPNRYDFPRQETLDRLTACGAEIWRTDESGAVTLWFSRDGLTAEGYDPPSAWARLIFP